MDVEADPSAPTRRFRVVRHGDGVLELRARPDLFLRAYLGAALLVVVTCAWAGRAPKSAASLGAMILAPVLLFITGLLHRQDRRQLASRPGRVRRTLRIARTSDEVDYRSATAAATLTVDGVPCAPGEVERVVVASFAGAGCKIFTTSIATARRRIRVEEFEDEPSARALAELLREALGLGTPVEIVNEGAANDGCLPALAFLTAMLGELLLFIGIATVSYGGGLDATMAAAAAILVVDLTLQGGVMRWLRRPRRSPPQAMPP